MTYEEITREITMLKSLLTDTDYKALKHSEGEISGEDYAETKLQRRAWRERINELEAEIPVPDEEGGAENGNNQ